MSFVDKLLHCSDCGADFTFSAQEQDLFVTRGYTNEPRRCPLCRAARKSQNHGFPGYRRQMFPVVCAECGKETEVPFEPRDGRPVYCSVCYDKVRLSARW